MGHHFSLPSFKHIEHAVVGTVASGIKSALKDIHVQMPDVSVGMPVNKFLHLPFMKDVINWPAGLHGDYMKGLAGTVKFYGKWKTAADVPGILRCWEADFNKSLSDYNKFEKYVIDVCACNPRALNLAVLTAHPWVRAKILRKFQVNYDGPGSMRFHWSYFTETFMKELQEANTLLSDLLPYWGNLGKYQRTRGTQRNATNHSWHERNRRHPL